MDLRFERGPAGSWSAARRLASGVGLIRPGPGGGCSDRSMDRPDRPEAADAGLGYGACALARPNGRGEEGEEGRCPGPRVRDHYPGDFDRKNVVEGRGVSVRVDRVGLRIIKKKT